MRKKSKFISNRLILQYALRYGIVIFITVALVLMLVSRLLESYKELLVERVRDELHEAAQDLDIAFAEQYNLAKEISISSKASGSYIIQSQLTGMEGITQLEVYRKTISDTCDYLFVSYNQEELFSNTGSALIKNYLNGRLRLDEQAVERLEKKIIEQQETMEVLKTQDDGHLLVWLYPVNQVLEETRAVVGFVVEDETLHTFFRKRFENEPLYAVMTDSAGEILFELNLLGKNIEEMQQLRDKLVADKMEDIYGYEMDSYISDNGYVFRFAVQEDYIFSDFYHTLYGVLFYLFLIFVIVLVLMFVVNNIHIRQIRDVRDVLLEYQDAEGWFLQQSEFEQIHSLITRLHQRQMENESRRRLMYRGMSGQMARLLFDGHIDQEEVLRGLADQLTPELTGEYYSVFGVFFREQECVSGKLRESIFMEKYFPEEEFPVCTVDNFNGIMMLSFVAGLMSRDSDGAERGRIAQLLLSQFDEDNKEAVIVVGKAYPLLCDVRKSYDEMLSLSYTVLCQENWDEEAVFIFDIALKAREYRKILGEDIRKLEEAIRKGILSEVEYALEKVIADIEKETEPLAKKFSCYVLLQSLSDIYEEFCGRSVKLDKLLRLFFEDMKAFEQGILKSLRSVMASSERSVDTVMQYINENFQDSAMGLDALAARFHMSISSVSKKIKEQTGLNYTEHVSRLRICEACRLLEETELSIQEITYMVGYSDYGSFSKKFKSVQGISPGEYRRAHKR